MPKRCFYIATVVISLVVGMFLCEGALRVFTPPWLGQRMAELNPQEKSRFHGFGTTTNWFMIKEKGRFKEFVPFSQFRMWHYEFDVIAHIDQWGGRRTKDPSLPVMSERLPFLGDSVVFGVGVEDYETFASLIGEQLGIKVLNLGSPGSNLVDQVKIIELRHEELGFPRRYMINFFLGNDIWDVSEEESSYAGRSKGSAEARTPSVLWGINNFVYKSPILKKIYFIQLVRMPFVNMYNRLSGNMAMDPIFITMDSSREHFVRENVSRGFEVELKKLLTLSRERNFNVVFILIPDRYQVYTNMRVNKTAYYALNNSDINPDLPNNIIIEILKRHGVPYIDVTDDIRMNADFAPLYYVNDNHPTAAGHRVIAKSVYIRLKQLLMQ